MRISSRTPISLELSPGKGRVAISRLATPYGTVKNEGERVDVPSLDLSDLGVVGLLSSARNDCSNDHQFRLLTILADLNLSAAHGELPAF